MTFACLGNSLQSGVLLQWSVSTLQTRSATATSATRSESAESCFASAATHFQETPQEARAKSVARARQISMTSYEESNLAPGDRRTQDVSQDPAICWACYSFARWLDGKQLVWSLCVFKP